IPCASFSRITSSPAAGLPVVPFVTVPLRLPAEAIAISASNAAATRRITLDDCINTPELPNCRIAELPNFNSAIQQFRSSAISPRSAVHLRQFIVLQTLNLGQQGGGLVFQRGP